MDKKKLLIITSTFPRWQNDTDPPFVFELAKRLTDVFDIKVLAPHYPGAFINETFAGLEIHRFRYFFKKLEILAGSQGILPTLKKNKLFYLLVPFFILAEFFALLKLIKKTKPHIIHAHWILPQGFVTSLAHKITGIPYVITTHGGDIYGLQGKFASALKGFSLKNAKMVTVVSKDIQKTIKQKFGDDIHTKVLPMGVDSDLFHPDNKNPQLREQYGIKGPFLLYVGRLSEKKGIKYLIEAMQQIIEQNPEAKLLIIGTGEEGNNLQLLSEKLGLTENVIFADAVPNKDLPPYFASSDIFIGPSIKTADGDTEGFGLTFVEAGMSGCYVIATDVGGIGDIIEHEKTGFMVKEKNSNAIAVVLLKILEDQENLISMKKNTRERMIKLFDWKPITDQYAEILKNNALH